MLSVNFLGTPAAVLLRRKERRMLGNKEPVELSGSGKWPMRMSDSGRFSGILAHAAPRLDDARESRLFSRGGLSITRLASLVSPPALSIRLFLWLTCRTALSVIACPVKEIQPHWLSQPLFRAHPPPSPRFTPLNPISVYRFVLPSKGSSL